MNKTDHSPDNGPIEQALQRCRNGDIDALEVVYREYQNTVFRLAYRMARDEAEAADWTQDIFIRVFNRLDSYNAEAKFSTWLYRLSVNFCLDQLKRASRREHPLTLAAERKSASPDPEKALLENEKGKMFRGLVQELSQEMKTVLILKELEGLSYAEISRILDIPEGTVGSRLNQARKILASKWKGTLRQSHDRTEKV